MRGRAPGAIADINRLEFVRRFGYDGFYEEIERGNGEGPQPYGRCA